MLESTYMATHSSFFAMIGVAEQFASLRTWLGEVLSVFTLLRFVKRMLGWGGGAEQTAASNGMSAAEFSNFSATGRTSPLGSNGQAAAAAAGGAPGKPKVSKKPIVIFFLTVIGLPWLMNKLVKLITAKQQAEARRLGLPEGAIPPILDQNGQPLPQHLQPPGVDLALFNNPQLAQQQRAEQEAAIDPASLTFVRAQYDHASNDEFELSFNKGDIIAVLTPKEERIEPGWWRGRLRDGRIGWFPSTHVQEIPMNNAQKKLEQPALNEKATKA
jgi:peroxin-13